MTVTNVLNVHAKVMTTGSVFLWGTRPNQGVWDPIDLKYMLFAWHKSSFFGTFIEERVFQDLDGIELPALEALQFFTEPQTIQHMNIQWSAIIQDMMKIAPVVQAALVAGQVMPDYTAWKKGILAWKLQFPADQQHLNISSFPDWIQAILTQWIASSPALKDQIQHLQTSIPRFMNSLGSRSSFQDEEDWLVSIGWNFESRPTRTCIQLIEPKESGNWQLNIVIHDRLNPEMQRVIPTSSHLHEIDDWPDHWSSPTQHVISDIYKWKHLAPALFVQSDPSDTASEPSTSTNLPELRKTLDEADAWRFLTEDSLTFMEAGYIVLYPAWWITLRKTKPKLRMKVKSSVGSAHTPIFGMQQLVDFDWRLAIGDIELTEEEFRLLLTQKQRLMQIRGNWIQLDSRFIAQIEQILKKVSRKKGLSFRDVLELHFSNTSAPASADDSQHDLELENSDAWDLHTEVELNDQIHQLLIQLHENTSIPIVETPSSFQGTLRQYQTEGASWLIYLRKFGLGGLLADDMGLGKTIQWITYLLHLKDHEQSLTPSLLICPTSVLGNWQMELKRFAPTLNVHLHYGSQRLKGDAFQQHIQAYDLVLTSYTLSHLDASELSSISWNSICLDEAQNIKNTYTKQSMTIRKLQGQHRIALTGTPIENRLTELWSIFDFINPGYLGSLKEFSSHYVNPIEKERNPELIHKVQKLIRPFLLRRMKKDPAVQLDLPEKYEATEYIPLTVEQGILYENYIQDMFTQIDQLSKMERRGLILKTLTKLKQLCNHPALVLKEKSVEPWRDRSNKLERLLDIVRELREQGDKCLIFTQFVETGHLLQRVLEAEIGEKSLFLHGGTSKAMRDDMIARFQDESHLHSESHVLSESLEPNAILILSLKAGGVGLNLTAASHVFHFDRWWNPAVEKQATDRAYRWGQKRNVHVHTFVTIGTLEERIHEMLERKQGLSEQIVGAHENWITELSTDDLKEVFKLRQEWV